MKVVYFHILCGTWWLETSQSNYNSYYQVAIWIKIQSRSRVVGTSPMPSRRSCSPPILSWNFFTEVGRFRHADQPSTLESFPCSGSEDNDGEIDGISDGSVDGDRVETHRWVHLLPLLREIWNSTRPSADEDFPTPFPDVGRYTTEMM